MTLLPAALRFALCLTLALLWAGMPARVLAQHAGPEARVSELIRSSGANDEVRGSARCRAALEEALAIAKQARLPKAEGDVYTAQGQSVYDDRGVSWERKATSYRLAAGAYERAGAWDRVALSEAEVARALENGGAPAAAIAHLESKLPGLARHDSGSLPLVYGYLGMLYMTQGDQARSIRYGMLAVRTAEAAGATGRPMSDIYNNISSSYYAILKFDSAYSYLRKAIAEAERANDTALIFDNYFNLVTILPDLNRSKETFPLLDHIRKTYPVRDPQYQFKLYYLYTNAYLESGQPQKAGPWFEKLRSLEAGLPAEPDLYQRFLPVAIQYNVAVRQLQEARMYLSRRDTLLSAHYSLREHCSNERYWFVVDSMSGNYPAAIKHYQKYAQLMDSIFSIEKTTQLNELQISYQTASKDKDIRMLRDAAALKDATIQKQGTIRNLIIVGALLLLALLIAGFSRYRLKQRINRQLEQQQEEINEQNELLKGLLRDKEWLLKEIHHRVKNNLQIVISLLNTQSAYLDNEQGLSAITDSRHRMQAMSLIHQKLYQSEDMGMIDMSWYIRTLATHMQESYGTGSRIRFELGLASVALDVAQAVPAGLILNEAISNAIKYAFPDGRRGTVSITLSRAGDAECVLVIADDGVGLPPELDVHTSDSLGMSLMIGLSAQLGGELELDTEKGTRLAVRFTIQTDAPAPHAPAGAA